MIYISNKFPHQHATVKIISIFIFHSNRVDWVDDKTKESTQVVLCNQFMIIIFIIFHCVRHL